MIVYKIQRADGLFSSGGTSPRFSKKGKSWAQRGHVTNHLGQLSNREKEKFYFDCNVVEFEIVEIAMNNISVFDWKPTDKTLRAKELEEQRHLEWQKEFKEAEIKKLEAQLSKLRGK